MNRSMTTSAKCFIPSCKNTTTNSRNKLFLFVRENLKRKWCEEVNVEYKPGKRLFCCEDHLNLKEDLQNYQYYKLMNGKPILKSTAKLRRIQNLPSRSTDETSVAVESPTLKSLLLQPIENLQIQHRTIEIEGSTVTTENVCTKTKPTVTFATTHPMKIDAASQCLVKMINQSTSTRGLIRPTKILTKPTTSTSSSCEITPCPSLYGSTSDTESTASLIMKDLPNYSARKQILQFISNDPKAYLGLPKQYFWLIKYIVMQSDTKITELDLVITLFKIKLNDPVHRICDQFQISRVTYSLAMHTGIQVLAIFFQNLVYMPSFLLVKRNQPLAFKIRYSNVYLLLDAFEIEIQKPHNPIRQAQTWSQYKNANTVKYLIGCTPNGFVSYISMGYGGRISDKALVEKSGLIDFLPDNAVIMADRGFKEIEGLLMVKRIKLLRPPSVYASNKPTKEQIIQTKVIASLRVHVERVIRRVREFRFLKPHSVLSHKHVGYLDQVVLIACGLINLQKEIIKSE